MSLFSLKRRLILGTVAALAAGATSFSLIRTKSPVGSRLDIALLTNIVDTILPADETPGALDLGLDTQLIDYMNDKERQLTRFGELAEVVERLSSDLYAQNFENLSVDHREQILMGILENREQPALLQSLFQIRSFVMQRYYLSEQGHANLGYTLPSNYPSYTLAKLA